MRHAGWVVLMAALASVAWPALAQEARAPVAFEDLKALYKEAPLIVHFQADSVQGNPAVSQRLTWEVQGPVIDVFKGSLLPGKISLHVESVVRAFDMKKSDVEGKQFLAAVKPLSDTPTDRRFQMVGPYAFAASGKEADVLRKLAETDSETGAGGQNLELTVRPIDKVFAPTGSKTIEIRLTNKGTDSATYLQAPVSEKDGKLYLPGQGKLIVRDPTGRTVPDKGNVVTGQVPPPPPEPAFLVPNANFVKNVDLSKYFTIPEGRYTLLLVLATPDGRGRIPSNAFSFQVGGAPLPPEPATPKVEVVKPPEPAVPEKTIPSAPPAAPAVNVPDPAKYAPGKASAGLAGLLRPSKARYALGEPVDLEFRLINQGPRTVAVDARIERTLAIQVQSVGDSPQPLVVRQIIPWPPDGATMPAERAFLREAAFWGRTLNLNTLFGKALDELAPPTPEEIAAGKALTYERFGRNLFGFPKPGLYNVTATYTVSRPHPAEGQPPAEQAKEWWIGELVTNPITIQVGEPMGK